MHCLVGRSVVFQVPCALVPCWLVGFWSCRQMCWASFAGTGMTRPEEGQFPVAVVMSGHAACVRHVACCDMPLTVS